MEINAFTFRSFVIQRGEIPSLPDTLEELEKVTVKISGGLKIIERQNSLESGTTIYCAVLLECPFCKSRFTGLHSEGCFHSITYPFSCPVCDYPNNISKKIIEIKEKVEKRSP